LEPLGSGGFVEVWKCEAPGGIYKAIKFVHGYLQHLQSDGFRAEEYFRAIEPIKSIRNPFLLSLDRTSTPSHALITITDLTDHHVEQLSARHRATGASGIPRS